ncbi:MAG: DHH family phosphoesterase [Thermoplasmata archaeon]|nr:MAG: DHH family phosphoesterase [Thermoplasmata archaeon]
MQNCAKNIAEYIKKHTDIEVVTHQDADGIAAGSIAKKALEREGVNATITVLKQLDESFVQTADKSASKLYWFTDLGSGNLDLLTDLNVVITDHHELEVNDIELSQQERTNLMELSRVLTRTHNDFKYHLNPHLFDLDGVNDLSGAGATYLVAKAMRPENIDLSTLAVIGAVGDLQDVEHGRLIGTNRKILEDAEKIGNVKSQIDIRFFGRESRPLHRFLMYANDPVIPGLSKSESRCINFFKELGVPLKSGEHWRYWVDLDSTERKLVISELTLILVNNDMNPDEVNRMVGEIYILPNEQIRTEVHDAKEFATLLNSCGRYGAADIGIKVCLGNRMEALSSARKMLKGHRSNLVEMLKIVRDIGVSELEFVQYFNAKDRINENVIGIVTGMMLNSGELDTSKPLLGFALCDDGKNIKASVRVARQNSEFNLNLSDVMRTAAGEIGGIGGGHSIAAGAQIPAGEEEHFLERVNELLRK